MSYSICNKQTYNFDILSRILHYHLVKYYNFYIKSHVYCKKFTRSIYIYIYRACSRSFSIKILLHIFGGSPIVSFFFVKSPFLRSIQLCHSFFFSKLCHSLNVTINFLPSLGCYYLMQTGLKQ